MGKMLENLKWQCQWVSQLGCMKGCANYLGLKISDAWLFGATGYSFILNIHEVVCPSGPTAWDDCRMIELAGNIGLKIAPFFVLKNDEYFAEKQRLAWEKVKDALDAGKLCYGWELEIPEYYVITGYDDVGYYYSGPGADSGKGPKPWDKLGDTKIGILGVFVTEAKKPADEIVVVKEAFEFVKKFSQDPGEWVFPLYKSGIAGYELWIDALKNGKADVFGVSYNAAVWSECRKYAVGFLREAKERLDNKYSPLFDEAVKHYEPISKLLEDNCKLFPFPPKGDELENQEKVNKSIEYLEQAKEHEAKGLEVLQKIAEAL